MTSQRRWPIHVQLTVSYALTALACGLLAVGATLFVLDRTIAGRAIYFPAEYRAKVEQELAASGDSSSAAVQKRLARDAEDERSALRHELFRPLVLPVAGLMGGIVAVSPVLGYVAARRSLRPLRRIAAVAGATAAHETASRVALGGPTDDLRVVADAFDNMVDRLKDGYERQRRFAADASHELRGPIATVKTAFEVSLRDPQVPPPTRSLIEKLLPVVGRQERAVTAMLTLAGAQQGGMVHEPVDLFDVAELAVRGLRVEAGTSVPISLSGDHVTVLGDCAQLEVMVANLVRNAATYNLPDGYVRVRVIGDGDTAALSVVNSGPRVQAETLAHLVEPFRRGEGRTSGDRGVGLGLSIVLAIAARHAASVSIEPQEVGGLLVVVRMANHSPLE